MRQQEVGLQAASGNKIRGICWADTLLTARSHGERDLTVPVRLEKRISSSDSPRVANHCFRLGVRSGVHSIHWRIFNISVMLSGYASASPSGALPVICVWGLSLVSAEGEFEKDTIVVE